MVQTYFEGVDASERSLSSRLSYQQYDVSQGPLSGAWEAKARQPDPLWTTHEVPPEPWSWCLCVMDYCLLITIIEWLRKANELMLPPRLRLGLCTCVPGYLVGAHDAEAAKSMTMCIGSTGEKRFLQLNKNL